MEAGESKSSGWASKLDTREHPMLEFRSEDCLLAKYPLAEGETVSCSI